MLQSGANSYSELFKWGLAATNMDVAFLQTKVSINNPADIQHEEYIGCLKLFLQNGLLTNDTVVKNHMEAAIHFGDIFSLK